MNGRLWLNAHISNVAAISQEMVFRLSQLRRAITFITLLSQVVSAMVSLKPIVTMDYLMALEKCLEENKDLPDPTE